ncbi:zinc-ribbon domain-containing protein [Parabacteroides faecis]|uniref:zinc-ribbon domain-containing protein n=2 Tax=Parabacteroides faecis TaxID=1217282 RepID=UPI0035B15A5B
MPQKNACRPRTTKRYSAKKPKNARRETEEMAHSCPNCGTYNSEGTNFCQGCGTRLAPPAQAPAAKRFCPNCGAEVAAGYRFCSSCGTNVG